MGICAQAAGPEGFVPFRWANVSEGNAIAISITGMVIVFTALTLISAFIAALPRILSAIERYLPAVEDHHHAPAIAESLRSDEGKSDEEQIVAAIGHILHTEIQHVLKQ